MAHEETYAAVFKKRDRDIKVLGDIGFHSYLVISKSIISN